MARIDVDRRGSVGLVPAEAMTALDFADSDELIAAWTRIRVDGQIRAA